jgi:hypothetical protein
MFAVNKRSHLGLVPIRKIVIFLALGGFLPPMTTAVGQTAAPLVIAFQAPDGVNNCGSGVGQCACGTAVNSCFNNFVTSELPYVSGIGISVNWASIDHCIGSNAPCNAGNGTDLGGYTWSKIDSVISSYVSNVPTWGTTACAGMKPCKVAIILYPEADQAPTNGDTPPYVFNSTYANSLGPPQDVIVCEGYQGGTGTPVTLITGDPWRSSDYGIWSSAGVGGTCSVFPTGGSHLQCTPPFNTVFNGYPIVYEAPIKLSYQNFLNALAYHYGTSGSMSAYAQYIAYVRPGIATGGEDFTYCANMGRTPSGDWNSTTALPGGYTIVPTTGNGGSFQYIAENSGTTGSNAPAWCQSIGCYTGADGGIARWHNVGAWSAGSSSNAMWPGPAGQSSEPAKYNDNGYLTQWPNPTDGTGYVASMMQFLAGVSAPFPWTVATHIGPQNNPTYADVEAQLAAANRIGFGMQSLNIYDPVTYALGIYPTSRQDWAQNFQKYPNVPIHHLQMNFPGQTYQWAGFPIVNITVSGLTATVTCGASLTNLLDCSYYSEQDVFITGSSYPSLNGIWPVDCGGVCAADTVQFTLTSSVPPSTYPGGTVWSPNDWTITMPFAVQRGVTSLEVYECDLDYAFGVQSTNWVTNTSGTGGCYNTGALTTPDPNYQSVLSNTLAGQPKSTSLHTESSVNVTNY